MSRILHIAQPTSAGVAGVVESLIADQVRAGWDVRAVCPANGPLLGTLAGLGVDVRVWAAVREIGPVVVQETRQLARLIGQLKPDLVHLHSAKAGLAGRLAIRGRVPTVYQPHAWSFEAAAGLLYRMSLSWERQAARWTDLVLCVSEHERRRGQAMGIDASMVVAPNGVDVARFRGIDESRRTASRRKLGLPSGPLAICVGRLCPQKGQDVLLDAWGHVASALPDARLVFVGDGPQRSQLMAKAPPDVVFAGACADPLPWYAAADLVVLPSRWEAMPLVLLEAMASGRSVVATDVGGVREAMTSSGGGIVPVGDPVRLALSMLARLSHSSLAAAEGAANQARALAHHDHHRTSSVVRNLYTSTLANSTQHRRIRPPASVVVQGETP